jgi:hypothetical protein
MIGNDMQLDSGVGTCGKEGQSVPVGVGQPTLRIDGLTVGRHRLNSPRAGLPSACQPRAKLAVLKSIAMHRHDFSLAILVLKRRTAEERSQSCH